MSTLTDLGEAWNTTTWIHFDLSLANIGFTADEIKYESNLLKAIGFNPMLDEDLMKSRYYTAVRVGHNIRSLDILEREAIVDLYLAAANKAAFALRDL